MANEPSFPPLTDELRTVYDHDPRSIYGEEAIYRVYRDGKPIGLHSVGFKRYDSDLFVEVDSSLAVRALGVTLYRYQYSATEIWRNNELISVETRIKDNRKAEKLISAKRQDNKWIIKKGQSKLRGAVLPDYVINHWHPGVLFAKRIYHPLHGRVYRGEPEDKGSETIKLEDGTFVDTRRFEYSAGFLADVWYDKDWRWVKLAFKADDDSQIIYRCDRCRPEPLASSVE